MYTLYRDMEPKKPTNRVNFNVSFPHCDRWDDPDVTDALRKQALAIAKEVMKGRKPITGSQQRMAELILGRFVASQAPQNVHFHLTASSIEEAKKRAGLIPEIKLISTGQKKTG